MSEQPLPRISLLTVEQAKAAARDIPLEDGVDPWPPTGDPPPVAHPADREHGR